MDSLTPFALFIPIAGATHTFNALDISLPPDWIEPMSAMASSLIFWGLIGSMMAGGLITSL